MDSVTTARDPVGVLLRLGSTPCGSDTDGEAFEQAAEDGFVYPVLGGNVW